MPLGLGRRPDTQGQSDHPTRFQSTLRSAGVGTAAADSSSSSETLAAAMLGHANLDVRGRNGLDVLRLSGRERREGAAYDRASLTGKPHRDRAFRAGPWPSFTFAVAVDELRLSLREHRGHLFNIE